ncbi:MAG TPA: hypothetical protein EYQ18_03880 [Candidatus Handelsmanbacteria bacterium]|nr:hypothetical protein [Candidatus Handelsmanbacteria bacterium]
MKPPHKSATSALSSSAAAAVPVTATAPLLVTVKLYLLLKGLDVRLLNDDQVAELRAAFPS